MALGHQFKYDFFSVKHANILSNTIKGKPASDKT